MNETTQHQRAAALYRLDGRAPRLKGRQGTLGRRIVVANLARMSTQLVSHQRHARANETAQMLSLRADEIRSDGSAKINDHASTARQVITSQQRQPTVQTETLVLVIAIADAGQLLSRPGDGDSQRILSDQQVSQPLRLFFGANADQPAMAELKARDTLQRLQ
ncbi:hypothetical protein D3C80_1407070 [compost metagenome]